MKDKFEIFIKTQVEADDEKFEAKEIAWKGLEHKLQRRKIRRFIFRLSVAAGLIVLIVGGAWLSLWVNNCDANTSYCSQVSGELAETEFYFARLIEEKYQEISATEPFDKSFFEPFFDELRLLDTQYQDYKTEIETLGCQEELVQAMIENQHQKLDILNRLLIEIKKINNYEKRKNEHQI